MGHSAIARLPDTVRVIIFGLEAGSGGVPLGRGSAPAPRFNAIGYNYTILFSGWSTLHSGDRPFSDSENS
jgi:hypothetical protein